VAGVGVRGAGSVVDPGVSDFDMILAVNDVVPERELLDEVALTLCAACSSDMPPRTRSYVVGTFFCSILSHGTW
jgi:hypothetical protein